jgi:hypothetical protein
LLTDIGAERRLRRFERLASGLPAAYGERYALEPAGLDEAWVVLFARGEDYLRYAGDLAVATRRPLLGHSMAGLAALPADIGADEVAQVLVHELAHLLHRAAGLPPLPPWLEEGMANDLAFSRVDSAGRLALDTVNGSTFMSEGRLPVTIVDLNASKQTMRIHPPEEQIWGNEIFHYSGARASLVDLAALVGQRRVTPLATLVALPPAEFARGEGFQERYAQSAFLVRFLLDDAEPQRAARFREFLAWTDAGREPTADELERTLDVSLEDLEPEFHAWLLMQVEGF